MAKSNDLYDLIKSLSKSEKRYFKLTQGFQKGEKNYIRLFDFIDQMEKYDEQEILETFKGETFIKQLHVTKNYLHKQLMKALRAYYAERRKEIKIREFLENAEILQQRGLNHQSFKHLKKAEKLAIKYQVFAPLIQIYFLKINIILQQPDKNVREVIRKQYELLKEAIRKTTNIGEYFYLSSGVYLRFQMAGETPNPLLKKELISEVENLLKAHNLEDDDKPDSFHAAYLHHFCNFLYYRFLKGDIQQAYECSQKIILIWDDNPHFSQEYPTRYRRYLQAHMSICRTTKNYDEFQKRLREMRKLPINNFDEEAQSFLHSYFEELRYYMDREQFEKGAKLVKEIERGLNKYNEKIPETRKISFYHNIAVLLFAIEDYEEALFWVLKISLYSKLEARAAIQSFARVFELILHFELGNTKMIDRMQNSTYRKLLRLNWLNDFERIVLRGISGLTNAINNKEKIEIFESMEDEINKLENKRFPGLEETSIWLESKIEGSSFIDVLHRRNEADKDQD